MLDYFLNIPIPKDTQPPISIIPPIGAIMPKEDIPDNAMVYKLPQKMIVPIEKNQHASHKFFLVFSC
jgi:hypothetical protein